MALNSLKMMFLLLFATIAVLRAQSPPIVLKSDKPITERIDNGQSRSYQIGLKAGRYVEAVVMQQGIDVVVRLFGPDGKKLLEVDSPYGTEGPESIFYIAQTTGLHRLEVGVLDPAAKPGAYRVQLLG